MKLIHVNSLRLEDFPGSDIPKYAILSHTWEPGSEVTYQEMISPGLLSLAKTGYQKIEQACKLAFRDHYDYIWIDTCCIDKTSSAELSEAINSMYLWYANADQCYVYLSDLPHTPYFDSDAMARCRWFTRGWTLQELIAPSSLDFYDAAWHCVGTKDELAGVLSNWTRIPSRVLNGNISIDNYSIAMRMSWAAHRKTTRIEDSAYALLGIFDVNMPLLYGEGKQAFRRLQEEIIKRSNDMSIFAWEAESDAKRHTFAGLLARSSACFVETGTRDFPGNSGLDYAITNKGLRITGEVELKVLRVENTVEAPFGETYALCLDYAYAEYQPLAIYLHKVGPGLFCRNGTIGITRHADRILYSIYVTDCYIILDPPITIRDTFQEARRRGIRIADNPIWTMTHALPDGRWDAASMAFLAVPPSKDGREVVALMDFTGTIADQVINLTILCDFREDVPKAKVTRSEDSKLGTRMMRHQKYREHGVHWVDLEFQAPELCRATWRLQLDVEGQHYGVSGTFKLLRPKSFQAAQWHLVIETRSFEGSPEKIEVEEPARDQYGVLKSLKRFFV